MAEKETKAPRPSGRPEGGNTLENIKIIRKKNVQINPDFQLPQVSVKEVDKNTKKFRCCMCGKVYTVQKSNFPSSNSILWKGNNGYVPICKSCCETLMDTLTSFYSGNEEHALRHLCNIFDWYYCEEASAMTQKQATNTRSRISLYPSKVGMRNISTKGETFLDTVRDESEANGIITEPTVVTSEDGEEEFAVTRDMIRMWGQGYTPDQYQYLEEEYGDWCAKNVCNTKAQQVLYKNIAVAQLNVRIAQQRGSKVTDAMKALQELMNSANILPKQNADNILADTQTFGTLLKKFEETAPIPEPSPEWRDVDGVRRYMNTWFRGGLAKALKINNENTALYDEAVDEMQRYTVQPIAESTSESANDSSIFDQNGSEEGGGS